jgi:large subunit ribosomal protein L10
VTKEQKAEIVQETAAKLEGATGLYFTSFLGLTVLQANALRSEFYKIGVQYKVVKNTLLKLALDQVGGYDEVYPYLVNQTGLVISHDDPIQPARVIEKFLKENKDVLQVKACVVEKQVFDGTRLSEVAALPTREDIMASIVGSLAAPITGVVRSLNKFATDLVYAVDAIEKQKADAA